MSNFVAISDARANLPDLVQKVNENSERVIITVNGKPKAVMMSFEDLESLKETAEILSIPKARENIIEGLKQAKKGLSTSLSDVKHGNDKKWENILQLAGVWDNPDGKSIKRNATHLRKTVKLTS